MIRGGILLFGLIFLRPSGAEAQWVNAYAAAQNDVIEAVAWIDESTLGKVIAAAGFSSSFSDGFELQPWVALIDPGGDYIWSKMYGAGSWNYATDIDPVTSSDGGLESLVVSGSNGGGGYSWIMEIDPANGNPVWQCRYEQFNYISSLVPTADGQFVFSATTEAPESALAIVKTDRSSTDPCGLGWARTLGQADPGSDQLLSLKTTSDGGIVAAGYTTLYGPSRGLVIKLGADGDPLWQATVASDLEPVIFYDVIEIINGEGNPDGFMAVGSFWFSTAAEPDSVMILTRLDPDEGSERWTRFYGYWLDGESLAARAVHQKPDGAIVVAGTGARDSDVPYHHRFLVLQLREDFDGDGNPTMSLEWQRELNPDAVWGNIDFGVTSMSGTPGGGIILSGYYPQGIFSNHDPLLMRLNEEGNIPPDCLLDPDPLIMEVLHDWDFEMIPEPAAIATTAGIETSGAANDQEIEIKDDCRPCVIRVNLQQVDFIPTGLTWDTAFPVLQDGIDAAANAGSSPDPTWVDPGYCEVWVAKGDYYVYVDDPTDTIQLKAGVHVYGGFSGGDPPESYGWEGSRDDRVWKENITRIIGASADDPDPALRTYHVVTAPLTNPSTLDGFHVVGGRANGDPGLDRWGAGMVNVFSSPTIANCTFYDNIASWGGAMANVFAAPDIINCTFATADNDPVFIQPNAAFAGGAILNWGWAPGSGDGPTIDECTFHDNYAKNFYGGGIHNQNSPAVIVRSTFSGNHAYAGGGVSIGQTVDGMGAPSIEACTFNDNVASRWWDTNNGGTGGALAAFFGQYVSPASYTMVENSLFHDNSTGQQEGGAIAAVTASNSPRLGLVNCTIADNANGGVTWYSEATAGMPPIIYNSILWNNGSFEVSPGCDAGAMVYYSDIMGGAGCEGFGGNISSVPEFDMSDPLLPYKLSEFSIDCIDAAEPASAPLTDITGAYRDPNPDIGAYEFFPDEEE